MTPINLFIGYDQRQPIAFQVAAHSVWQQATAPVSITRLDLRQLPITRRGLTEFTYSRFLVPYLSNFEGVSIFMDSDVLVRGDVSELLGYQLAFPDAAVLVVKHKMVFEQPSVMVFNNPLCHELTPTYVEDREHSLFKFEWVRSWPGGREEVAQLPAEWNHLVGYDKPNQNAKLIHFSQGIPIWKETKDCEFAEEWHTAAKQCNSSVSFEALMGRSVHVAHMQKVGA